MRQFVGICLGLIVSLTAACGGGGGSSPPPASPPPPPANVTIGGTVTGLAGTGLTLQNGTGTPLAITANGSFQFPGTVPNGTPYFVRVATQPGMPTRFCSAPNGAGIATSNTAITVICNAGTPRYLYVTDFATTQNLIYGIAVDPTGGVAPVGPATQAGQFPIDPAVTPAGAFFASGAGGFVYVRNSLDGAVGAYSINSATGVLTPVPGAPFSVTGQPSSIIQTVISPTGRFVYFLDQTTGANGLRRVFAYLIQPNGALVAIAGSPFDVLAATTRLEIDPLGRYLYGATSTTSAGTVATYRVDPSTGALSSAGTTPANGSIGLPRGVVHPSGQFLYVVRDTTILPPLPAAPTPAIDAYTIDTSTGQLTLVGSVPAISNNQSSAPIMDPQGRFLYVTGLSGIVGFRIDASTGALTWVGSATVLVNFNVGYSDIDPTGRFLYSPIRQGPSEGVTMHMIDQATGQLTQAAGFPFSLGANVSPNFVKADASGRYLFVATFDDDRVTSLAIDALTGLLTFRDSEPVGTNATQFAIAGTQ